MSALALQLALQLVWESASALEWLQLQLRLRTRARMWVTGVRPELLTAAKPVVAGGSDLLRTRHGHDGRGSPVRLSTALQLLASRRRWSTSAGHSCSSRR